jgi:tRNA-dihydrouridine synthase A
MNEPELVADGVKAMRDATALPVTVKHRIGIDRREDYGFMRDFVGRLSERGGCRVFVVHARNAWLQGLSPKENREVPPLRYELVHRLKMDFPQLTIVVNGGVADDDAIAAQLARVDGVMVGRRAYHEPFAMATWDRDFFGSDSSVPERDDIEAQYVDYMTILGAQGVPWSHAARHMLGLRHGQPGARRWRQVWSDHRLKDHTPAQVHRLAMAALTSAAAGALV